MWLKKCGKCQKSKPLDQFYPRKDAKDGHRGTCIECWLAHYRPGKRVSYAKHRERLNAERRAERVANPERFRLNDARYYLRHQAERRAASRAYYRFHRERLIADNASRRKRNRSMDYGWTNDLKHDRVQYELWQQAQSARERREQARLRLAAIVRRLSDEQRKFLAVFERCDMDLDMTAKRLGMDSKTALAWLLSIRRVAVRP